MEAGKVQKVKGAISLLKDTTLSCNSSAVFWIEVDISPNFSRVNSAEAMQVTAAMRRNMILEMLWESERSERLEAEGLRFGSKTSQKDWQA